MTITSDSIITEQLLYAAQKIVTYYGNELQQQMCLVQVPIATILEAQQYIDKAAVFNDSDKINGKTVDQLSNELSDFVETPLAAAIRNRANSNCFSCKLEFPKLDARGYKNSLIDDINRFLENGNGLLRPLSNGFELAMPNLTLLLSFLCIPDLAKLLSVLIARLLGMLFKINIGNYNLTGFIMAIIAKILNKMFSFLNTMIELGMSPVLCIFEALQTFTDLFPKAGQEVGNFPTALDNWIETGDQFKDTFHKVEVNIPKTNPMDAIPIKEQFDKVKNVISDSINSLSDEVHKLLGLKTYFECEAKRNGTSVADDIEGIKNVIGLINLIRQIMKRKSENISYSQFVDSQTPTNDFTLDDIAIVMSRTIEKEVNIATSDNTDVGVMIGKETTPDIDNLDIFKCNLVDFLDNSDYNQIITDAVNIPNVYSDGLDPTITRIALEDIYKDNNYTLIPISQNSVNTSADKIKAIIDYLGVVSLPPKDQSIPVVNNGNINVQNTQTKISDIDINSIITKLHQLS